MTPPSVFKMCPSCSFQWRTRDHFLLDSDLEIVGYQVNFANLEEGLFLFNHSCKTTLAIRAGAFKDLHDGPVVAERATGTEACPGHCLHRYDLNPCPAQCECNYVREVIQIIRNRPAGNENRGLANAR